MLLAPAEVFLEGLIDVAAKKGLKTVAIITEDTIFSKATAQGAMELAIEEMFQWQDGKKVIVWPEELAPGRARFPTPSWRQRP